MIIRRIQLLNFRLHPDTDVCLPNGLIGIVGTNGSGKSTLLEAAGWALYGMPAARGAKDTLRYNRAPTRRPMSVTLTIELAGKQYTITRSESDALVTETATGRKLAQGTSAVNRYMPELLGMSLEEFRAAFLAEQKALAPLGGMTGTPRREFVLGMMGMGLIDRGIEAVKALRKERKEEADKAAALLGQRGHLEQEFRDAELAVSDAKSAHAGAALALGVATEAAGEAAGALAESEDRQRRFTAAQQAVTAAQQDVARAQQEVERAAAAVVMAKLARARVEAEAPKLEQLPAMVAEQNAQRVAQADAKQRGILEQAVREAERNLADLERRIAAAEAEVRAHDAEMLQADEDELARAKAALERLRTARAQAIATVRAEVAHLTEELGLQTDAIKALRAGGPDGACPTCIRPLGDQFDAVIAKLQAVLDSIRQRGKSAMAYEKGFIATALPPALEQEEKDLALAVQTGRQRGVAAQNGQRTVNALRPSLDTQRSDLTKLRGQLAEIPASTYAPDRLAVLDREVAELRQVTQKLEADRSTAGQVPALEAEHEGRRAVLHAGLGKVSEALQAKRAVEFHPEVHELLVADAAAMREKRELAGRDVAARASTARDADSRLTRAADALQAYDQQAVALERLAAEYRDHDDTVQALVRFRDSEVATIRPEMEELVSGLVQLLTDGRHESAVIDEDFAVTLMESGVPVPVISGGTEDIVAIALRISISQMIARRAGHALSCLVLDEPFGALDVVRRNNVLDMIRKLRDTFSQVIVITHISEVRESVDCVIDVQHDEATGASTATSPAAVQPVAPVEVAA